MIKTLYQVVAELAPNGKEVEVIIKKTKLNFNGVRFKGIKERKHWYYAFDNKSNTHVRLYKKIKHAYEEAIVMSLSTMLF